MLKVNSVDEYIASAPQDIQKKLKALRATIKLAAPKAEEKISYSMPYYGYKGRLVYFSYTKNHIGLYSIPPTVEVFKKELKNYVAFNATVQFPYDKPLPLDLIKKMVKWRVKQNEENEK